MTRASASTRFLIVTVAAIAVTVGTFSLGQWQLRRAAQKQALQAAIASQSERSPLDSAAVAHVIDFNAEAHRRVEIKGRWVVERTVFLDNRPMGEKTGFWVVTPLALDGSDRVVLVQRGWVARDFLDRTRLAPIQTPAGPVAVTGRIAPPPSKLYAFKGEESGQIRQNIDLAAFRAETGLPLLEASVVQVGPTSEGLQRNWAAANLGVDRHRGYAAQWFALSALTAGLYAWFQLLVPYRRRLQLRKP